MEDTMAARYYCHACSRMVNPVMEVEIKCPFCRSGFVEEMGSGTRDSTDTDSDFGSDRGLSLWAPIFLGMMGNPHNRRRLRRIEFDDDDNDDENENDDGEAPHGRDTQLDREFESMLRRRRRRRSSATILQLLNGIRAGIASESENSENDRDRDRDRERERVILINPLSQTIIVHGSYGSNEGGQNQNTSPIGSLGDYFIGPGLDLLLQHLAENDPSRYGTPPAQEEAIEALPTVKIEENIQCSVCLDDFEIGTEAKEMPCKHKFHCGCILPWLELHSSCPVCRYQLPADDSKLDSERSRNNSTNQRESEHNNAHVSEHNNAHVSEHNAHVSENNAHVSGEESEGDGRNGDGRNGRRFTMPWPFNGLFSSSGSNSTSTSSGSPSGSPSQANEN